MVDMYVGPVFSQPAGNCDGTARFLLPPSLASCRLFDASTTHMEVLHFRTSSRGTTPLEKGRLFSHITNTPVLSGILLFVHSSFPDSTPAPPPRVPGVDRSREHPFLAGSPRDASNNKRGPICLQTEKYARYRSLFRCAAIDACPVSFSARITL